MSKHIKLTVGADIEASVDNFRRDLHQILAQADADPLKIRLDVDPASINTVTSKIQNALGSINLTAGGTNIGANISAQMNQAANTVTSAGQRAVNAARSIGSGIADGLNQAGIAATKNADILHDAISRMLTDVSSFNASRMLPATSQPLALAAAGTNATSLLNLDEYMASLNSTKLSYQYFDLNSVLPDVGEFVARARSYGMALSEIIELHKELSGSIKALPATSSASFDFASMFNIDQFMSNMNSARNSYQRFIDGFGAGAMNTATSDVQMLSSGITEIGTSAENATSDIQMLSGGMAGLGASAETTGTEVEEAAEASYSQLQKVGNIFQILQSVDFTSDSFARMVRQDSEEAETLRSRVMALLDVLKDLEITTNDYGVVTSIFDNSTLDGLTADKARDIAAGYQAIGASKIAAISAGKDDPGTLKNFQKEQQEAAKLAQSYQTLSQSIAKYATQNKSSMTHDQYLAFQQLSGAIASGSMRVEEAKSQFASLKTQIEANVSPLEKLADRLKNSIVSRMSYMAATAVFSAMRKAVREVYQNVVELDSAITDLQIATGYSREQTAALVTEYSQLGNAIGATTVEVAEAANAWLRQGYSAEQATQLVQSSMMLSKLGMIDASEATTALTSAINGYKMSADDAVSVVDKLTAVDMEAAASAGGLAVAMSKTATSAMTAGVSMDTLIGYIAKVKEVTQDGDEAVGTFFKTMLARMGNIKSGLLVDPETDENLGDVEAALSGVGIKLRDSNSEFRSLEDVLNDVNKAWNTYSSVQQRAIAKAFAGTRQQEKFLVLMENYDDAMKLAGVSAGSAGTAMQKYNDAYLQSYEAAKNSLTASTEAFSRSILDSKLVIGATKALDGLIKALTKLASINIKGINISGIATTMGAALATVAIRAQSLTKTFAAVQMEVGPMIGSLSASTVGTQAYTASIDSLILALQGKNAAVQKAVIDQVAATDATAADTVALGLNATAQEMVAGAIVKSQSARVLENAALQAGITAEERNALVKAKEVLAVNSLAIATGKMSTEELFLALTTAKLTDDEAKHVISLLTEAGALKVTDAATKKLTASQVLLQATGGPVVWAIAGIAAAAYALYKALKYASEGTDRLREDLEDVQSELETTTSDLDSTKQQLSDNLEKIDELSKARNISITDKAEIVRLQSENTELEYQIALLEARKKILEDNAEKDKSKLWSSAHSTDYGADIYTGHGEKMSGVQKTLSFAFGAPDGMYSKVDTAERQLYQLAYLENLKQYAAPDLWEEIDQRINNTKSILSSLAQEFQEMGGDGEKFANVITIALSDAGTQLELFHEELESIDVDPDKYADAMKSFSLLTQAGRGLKSQGIEQTRENLTNYAQNTLGATQAQIDQINRLINYAQNIRAAINESDNEDLKNYIATLTDDQLLSWYNSLIPKIKEFTEKQQKAANATKELSDVISSLNSASKGVSAIAKAFQELSEEGKVSFNTISDIVEELSGTDIDDNQIQQWARVLVTADKNSKEFKDTLSDMMYALVLEKTKVGELTAETEDYIASMLDSVGVANSAEVAHSMVIQAYADEQAKAVLAGTSSDDLATALQTCASEAGITTDAFAALVYQMIIFNNTDLDISQKLAALRTLSRAMGYVQGGETSIGGGDWGDFSDSEITDAEVNYWSQRFADEAGRTVPDESDRAAAEAYVASWYADVFDDVEVPEPEVPEYKPPAGGGSSGGGGGSSESALSKYNKQIEREQKQLELRYKRGEISAKEYFSRMEEIYANGYADLEQRIANGELSDADADEILDQEIGMLDKIQEAHNNAYNEEKRQLDHHLKMNHITEEQYFAELTRMYLQYYAGRAEYSEEAQEAEEELYEKGTAIVEKWANAAVDAVNAVSSAMQSMASAATDLLQGLIDANEHSFDRYYKNLQHELKMNYITEQQYTEKLDALYKRYFRDRYIYLDQYQQYEEEVYQAEQQALQDAASATEDIHGQVVDMIRDELEEQKDAIDETKQAYLDLIDIRRQALNDQKDEEDYEKEHAEKLAAVAELQRQLNALANDQSAEGVKKYKETLNSLHEAQEDLYDFEREHAYDSLEKQLDEQEEALENSASTRTEEIDKLLEDNEWLVAEAWRRMEGMTSELYDQLMAHHRKYSTAIKDDITEAWNTARDAMQRYYDGVNAHGGYDYINDRIGESGMSEAEAAEYNRTVGIKNVAEYTSVFVKAIAEFASAGASLVSSFASILNSVFPNPITSLMATGASGMASAVSGMGGIATNLFGFLGGLAGGSNFAPETGVYRTDEFGEELKLLKNTADGNYTLLTKGSKVFNARNTERLAKILEHPELLSGGLTPGVLSDIVTSIPSSAQVETNTQNVNYSQSFNITGNNPTEIANEIKGVIADYTLDVIRRNARTAGRTRSVSSVY